MQLEMNQDASQGWTLQQALERTADPNAWTLWVKARSDYEKIKTPIPSAPGSFITPAPHKVAECHRAALEAYNSMLLQLRYHLIAGSLAALGSREARSVPPTPIYHEGWRTLKFLNLTRSTVRETGAIKTRIYNVQVFPLIHADDAPAQLSGQGITKAFLTAVLGDPEVIAASNRLPDATRYRSIFEKGQRPGPVIDYQWPLSFTADQLASDFVRPIAWYPESPRPVASFEVRQVATIIADRWHRFRQRLIAGELVGTGIYVATGQLAPIAPLQWGREDACLDVQNGDLLLLDNNKYVVRWSSISLSKPSQAASSLSVDVFSPPSFEQAPSPFAARSSARRRPVAEGVANALAKHGLGNDHRNLSWKEIAAVIGPDMPRPPQTASEFDALAKAVKRHYESIEETPLS